MRRTLAAGLTIPALVAAVASLAGGTSSAAIPGPVLAPGAVSTASAAPARTAVLVLENRSYRQVIGNPNAPFLNGLARRYALATHYFALGHPSLPNYLALTTGSTWGLKQDCRTCRFDHTTLFGQLDRAHVSWHAYFQTLPAQKLSVVRTATYNPHYNPLAYLTDVRSNPADRARITGFTRLNSDLRDGALPRFSWIAPDIAHDGHSSTLAATDRYASRLVPRLLAALGPHGLLYVTWDEGRHIDRTGPGGGHIVLIAAGRGARAHARVRVHATHYALLRTIEHSYGLKPLGHAGSRSTPVLTGLLRRGGAGVIHPA